MSQINQGLSRIILALIPYTLLASSQLLEVAVILTAA
jgi:hypothetical protein